MLPVSSLSRAAKGLRDVLLSDIKELGDISHIKIGHPADTVKELALSNDNSLNLFFYDINYDGYPSDGTKDDPFYVRLYCLVTAIGADSTESDGISVGENELRLIGEVMRVFHEQPVLSIDDGSDNEVAQLQIVPHTMNLDNLNHIWSTQSDISYRLSVAYELSLAPVPMAQPIKKKPRVGEIGIEARRGLKRKPLPADGFGIKTSAPEPLKVTFDKDDIISDWAPYISFVDKTNSLASVLSISKSLLPADGFMKLKVLVAGIISDQVELTWEIWNHADGWKQTGSSQNEAIATDTIDPNDFDPALAFDIDLPINDLGQGTLYAERRWKRPDGSTVTLRSNPLLVTVHKEDV